MAALFAVILGLIYKKSDCPSQRDFIQFQKIVNEKLDFSESVMAKLTSLDSADFSAYENFRDDNARWFNSQDISLFVFENERILYWSDNEVTPYYSLLSQSSKLFFSGNAWYLMNHKKIENREFFLLFLLKNQYPFENEYIKNDFQRDFSLNSNVKIYEEPCENSFSIVDKDGHFLLSLSTDVEEWHENKMCRFFGLLCLVLCFAFFLLFLAQFECRRFGIPMKFVVVGFGMLFLSIPNLGRLYFESIAILMIAYFVFTMTTNYKREFVAYIVFVVFSFVICGTATGFMKSLALNSDIKLELFNLLSTNFISYVAYFLIAALLFLYFVFCFRFVGSFEYKRKYSVFELIGICVAFPFMAYIIIPEPSEFFPYLVVFYLVTMIISIVYSYCRKREHPTFFLKIVFLVFSVIYVEIAISMYIDKHKADLRQKISTTLADEQDGIAESYLAGVYKSTRNDSALKNLMEQSENKDVEIKNYLQKTYFTGWLKQYELECTVCGTDSSIANTNQLENCENYFKQMLATSGKSVSDTNYHFVNNQDGNITYFDSIQYNMPNGKIYKLYIEMHSKQNNQDFGYPKILMDDDIQTIDISGFSSAKYKNGILISKRGKCPYPQTLKLQSEEQFSSFVDKQHHIIHLAYRISDQFIVVVSNRMYQWNNYLMWFPYIFMIFFLLTLVFDKCYTGFSFDLNYSLSRQIRRSFVGLLVGTFLIVGLCGIVFVKARNNRQQQNFLEQRISAVANEFSQQFRDYSRIDLSEKAYIQSRLSELAGIHSSDINFYDEKGDLFASSRPEIFLFRLVSEKISPQAYNQLIKQNRMKYSNEETIGNLQFMSSYVTVTNSQNQVLGYLNLPNFTKQEDFTQQFAGLIVGLLNLFVVLLFLSTIISVFIAKKISAPLVVLQNKMKNVSVGAENDKIELNAPEELSALLENYNTMIDQLSVSAEKLAKAERENAWREMARQIAHEIKNPLTPMKLSIQLLNRSWDEKDEKFETRLKSISKTMIEQIDTLADTATSFSDFAKLSKVTLEPIVINDLLQNCVTLFSQEENVTVSFRFSDENVIVIADKEKSMRLFNNLIKNAVQAIPNDQTGEIVVSLEKDDSFAKIAVRDNGRGIDDDVKQHIFELHFTTKSTGSGFGLAICKNIVEASNGEIWFETEVGVGTTFFVKLPLQKD